MAAGGGGVVSAPLGVMVAILGAWWWYLDTRTAFIMAGFCAVVVVVDTARAVRRP